LRVSREEELEGLDQTEHGSVSYPDFVSLHWKNIKVNKEE
jgi:Amt family ammonium transporter